MQYKITVSETHLINAPSQKEAKEQAQVLASGKKNASYTLDYQCIKVLGTLYLVGRGYLKNPKRPSVGGDVPPYNGHGIYIYDTLKDENYGIRWVEVNGILIADRVIMSNVSWRQLDIEGFVEGREFTIDGKKYICRLPEVGRYECVEGASGSEWSRALAQTSREDDLWHWKGMLFWGREQCGDARIDESHTRGVYSPDAQVIMGKDTEVETLGFRPVLIPLEK